MSKASPQTSPQGLYRSDRLALIMIVLITAIRIALLPFSIVQLHGDEAQYWSWAQDLDWGYFSKPPLIAWIIAATTGVFGDAEWAARLGSPIFHAITASLLYLIGKKLNDGTTGLWAAAIYLLLPSVFLSSGIISTDVPLLCCFALAFLALLNLREQRSWKWAIILGLAIGFGLLAKYAMIYFIIASAIAIVLDKSTRKALLSGHGALAAMIAAIVFAPNIIWNMQNDFQTVSHTAANANVGGIPFHPLELLEFWISQTGIFGFVFIVLLVIAMIHAFRHPDPDRKLLLIFALLPLAVISIQALISRANANWAATSMIAACPLIALWGLETLKRKTWLKIGIAVNALIGVLFLAAATLPGFAASIGMANSIKRTTGWPETVTAIETAFNAGYNGESFDVLATDNRLVFYDLNYYGIKETAPLYMWLLRPYPYNHAEATAPLPQGNDHVLLINHYDHHLDEFQDDFDELTFIRDLEIPLAGDKIRKLKLYSARGYTPTTGRDPE